MAKTIKNFCIIDDNLYICIFQDLYSSQMSHLKNLVSMIHSDVGFSTMNDELFEVKLFGGNRYKGLYGIEARLPINLKQKLLDSGWIEVEHKDFPPPQ